LRELYELSGAAACARASGYGYMLR
jgi:hypothetical protein